MSAKTCFCPACAEPNPAKEGGFCTKCKCPLDAVATNAVLQKAINAHYMLFLHKTTILYENCETLEANCIALENRLEQLEERLHKLEEGLAK